MNWLRNRVGLIVAAYLAVMCYALVAWMPAWVENYRSLAETNKLLANVYLGVVCLAGIVFVGFSLYTLYVLLRNSWRKRARRAQRAQNPGQMSSAARQAELDDNLAAGREYADDQEVSDELRLEIQRELDQLELKHGKCRLEIVAFGTISSGKSALLNALAGREVFASDVVGGTTTVRSEVPWPGADEVLLVDTPGLAEVDGASRAAASAETAETADLVLLVVDGPLKSYEVSLTETLTRMEKRVVVCLNKDDWYSDQQREALVGQIAEQLPAIDARDIVTVRAAATQRERVRVAADGSESSEVVDVPPSVQALAERMIEIVQRDGRDLLLANLLLQSRGLVDRAKDRVREMLDERADEIISRHMWAAGGTAGINPIPLLDIAGGSAITLKMVLELARVYKQPLDTDSAIKVLEQLGKNLIAMVGVTAATPAVASAVGGMLKTVPGIGTIAGGVLQGVVQALVTRWIGNVFVEYFKREMKPPPGGLAELAQAQWRKLTTADALRGMVRAGRDRLNRGGDS
ncbi:MAG: DUF697 domain-containing protein [Planctomycetota bacterium]